MQATGTGSQDVAAAMARLVNLSLCLFVALRPHFVLLMDDVCNLDQQSWGVLSGFVKAMSVHRFNVLVVASSRPLGEVNDPYVPHQGGRRRTRQASVTLDASPRRCVPTRMAVLRSGTPLCDRKRCGCAGVDCVHGVFSCLRCG